MVQSMPTNQCVIYHINKRKDNNYMSILIYAEKTFHKMQHLFMIKTLIKVNTQGIYLLAQLCLTLCNLTDCSPSGSSVHGISQTRILEWIAISSSRGSSRPRDQTRTSCISCIGGRFITTEAPGKPLACRCINL